MVKATRVNGFLSDTVSVSDRGFQYGDGVFTTVLVQSGHPLFFTRHLDRLARDCQRLCIPFPPRAELVREGLSLCKEWGEGVLKVQITRGIGERGYRPPEYVRPTWVVSMYAPPALPFAFQQDGVAVIHCETHLGIHPSLAGIKHTNRLAHILARLEWKEDSIQEGLMQDGLGHIIEGTMTNLFLVHGGKIITPSIDSCGVAGIVRCLVMEHTLSQDRGILEAQVNRETIESADELFLTNSVVGVWPIRRIEKRDYKIGPITRHIQKWLAKKIENEITSTVLTTDEL